MGVLGGVFFEVQLVLFVGVEIETAALRQAPQMVPDMAAGFASADAALEEGKARAVLEGLRQATAASTSE